MREAFDWRIASEDEVEFQYSPSRVALRPLADYLAEYARLGAEAGDPAALRLPGRPLLLYVHGGYWQELEAADSRFNAADAIRERVSLVAVEYTLAPAATIEAMVGECVEAILDAVEELHPSAMVLAGSSAGAHLVASCLAHGDVSRAVDGAVLLSGIYDLRPLTRTTANAPLGLDLAEAGRLSPLFHASGPRPPTLVAFGGHETSEFKRQSHAYAEALRARGSSVTLVEVAERDHFNLPYDLLARGTTVGDWLLTVLSRSGERR